jgi:hypothetical protein
MSRFTEHFDIDSSQFIYAQTLSSPSKASFLSMSSSESVQPKAITMEPILTHSYSSFESNSSTMLSSPTSFEREESSEKPLSTKLKRFLTTMSKKKKRSMSNHSQ